MSTHSDDASSATTYFIDPENAAEMARLTKQAQMISTHVGLLPTTLDVSATRTVLDIACGPGAWALEMAARFPNKEFTGIDTSTIMIDYANYTAQAQRYENARFQVADATQTLPFADGSFDMVNTRYIIGFMHTSTWPRLFQECMRVLRPGGILCSSEPESLGTTNSPALARYNLLLTEALRKNGQCFSAVGEQFGIAAVQARQFGQAGFQQVRQEAHVVNYSWGQSAYESTVDNYKTFLKLLQPMIVHMGAIGQEDMGVLYAHVIEEMQAETFCGVGFFHRVWGQKPEQEVSGKEAMIAERRHRIDVPYVLPKDMQEIDRLDLQHYALRAILKGNYAAPIGDSVGRILDVGAGSGRWAIEMAESFPAARVVGVDIEFPPVTPPANCSFVQGNILTGLDFGDGSFDYVHQRLLVGAIPAAKWPFVLQELARVTAPAGWVELLESGEIFHQMGPITREFLGQWPASAKMTGFDLARMSHLDELFTSSGLVNVQMRTVPIPLGAWAGQEGEMMSRDIQAIFRAFKAIFVTRMGMEEQEFTRMIDALPAEWEQYQTSYEFYQVFGQKPLEAGV